MTNWHGNGGGWYDDAPVYSWEWPVAEDGASYDKHYGLPNVLITRQVHEPTIDATGRECVALYTPEHDPEGNRALWYGADYYNEGMSCDGEDEHEKRVMCFQAAELLYLHAAKKGNPIADLNLGYVYSYDRCEGRYWDRHAADPIPDDVHELIGLIQGFYQQAEGSGAEMSDDARRALDALIPQDEPLRHLEHACKHYRKAAVAGVAEACYKLGDLLRDGRGCEASLDEAYIWFARAFELAQSEDPVVWGSAALRLGRACEEGEGCEQSFEKAHEWYEKAATGLGIAVRYGERWYQMALHRAEAGLKRTEQELWFSDEAG